MPARGAPSAWGRRGASEAAPTSRVHISRFTWISVLAGILVVWAVVMQGYMSKSGSLFRWGDAAPTSSSQVDALLRQAAHLSSDVDPKAVNFDDDDVGRRVAQLRTDSGVDDDDLNGKVRAGGDGDGDRQGDALASGEGGTPAGVHEVTSRPPADAASGSDAAAAALAAPVDVAKSAALEDPHPGDVPAAVDVPAAAEPEAGSEAADPDAHASAGEAASGEAGEGASMAGGDAAADASSPAASPAATAGAESAASGAAAQAPSAASSSTSAAAAAADSAAPAQPSAASSAGSAAASGAADSSTTSAAGAAAAAAAASAESEAAPAASGAAAASSAGSSSANATEPPAPKIWRPSFDFTIETPRAVPAGVAVPLALRATALELSQGNHRTTYKHTGGRPAPTGWLEVTVDVKPARDSGYTPERPRRYAATVYRGVGSVLVTYPYPGVANVSIRAVPNPAGRKPTAEAAEGDGSRLGGDDSGCDRCIDPAGFAADADDTPWEARIDSSPPAGGRPDCIVKVGPSLFRAKGAAGAAAVITEVAGTLASDKLVWAGNGAVTRVTGTVTVPQGMTLRVQAGAVVLLAGMADIVVHGTIAAEGTALSPVVLAPWPAQPAGPSVVPGGIGGGSGGRGHAAVMSARGQPWGEVLVTGAGRGNLEHAWLTGGGGNTLKDRLLGHSKSQPVLRLDGGALVTVSGGGVVDSPGKAFYAYQSEMRVTEALFSRVDTGGELLESTIHMDHCHTVEVPDGDGKAEDDDNDGLYLKLNHKGGMASKVSNAVIALVEDDGVDQLGADVSIRDAWIEGAFHEGVATSGWDGGLVSIENSVAKRCEEGFEVGYGKPRVTIANCLALDCKVGVRHGDDYPPSRTHEGRLALSNSVVVRNSVRDVQLDKGSEGRATSTCTLPDLASADVASSRGPPAAGRPDASIDAGVGRCFVVVPKSFSGPGCTGGALGPRALCRVVDAASKVTRVPIGPLLVDGAVPAAAKDKESALQKAAREYEAQRKAAGGAAAAAPAPVRVADGVVRFTDQAFAVSKPPLPRHFHPLLNAYPPMSVGADGWKDQWFPMLKAMWIGSVKHVGPPATLHGAWNHSFWRLALVGAAVKRVRDVKEATLHGLSGCGASFRADMAYTFEEPTGPPPMPVRKRTIEFQAFFKAVVTDPGVDDSEHHLREIKTYYLDQLLGTRVVAPAVGRWLDTTPSTAGGRRALREVRAAAGGADADADAGAGAGAAVGAGAGSDEDEAWGDLAFCDVDGGAGARADAVVVAGEGAAKPASPATANANATRSLPLVGGPARRRLAAAVPGITQRLQDAVACVPTRKKKERSFSVALWRGGAKPKTLPTDIDAALKGDASGGGRLVEYVILNFIAGCMRSPHNHFFAPAASEPMYGAAAATLPAQWLALDNDRCMIPVKVATQPGMPESHKKRFTMWRELLWKTCAYPEHVVDAMREIVRDSDAFDAAQKEMVAKGVHGGAMHAVHGSFGRLKDRTNTLQIADEMREHLMTLQPEAWVEALGRMRELVARANGECAIKDAPREAEAAWKPPGGTSRAATLVRNAATLRPYSVDDEVIVGDAAGAAAAAAAATVPAAGAGAPRGACTELNQFLAAKHKHDKAKLGEGNYKTAWKSKIGNATVAIKRQHVSGKYSQVRLSVGNNQELAVLPYLNHWAFSKLLDVCCKPLPRHLFFAHQTAYTGNLVVSPPPVWATTLLPNGKCTDPAALARNIEDLLAFLRDFPFGKVFMTDLYTYTGKGETKMYFGKNFMVGSDCRPYLFDVDTLAFSPHRELDGSIPPPPGFEYMESTDDPNRWLRPRKHVGRCLLPKKPVCSPCGLCFPLTCGHQNGYDMLAAYMRTKYKVADYINYTATVERPD